MRGLAYVVGVYKVMVATRTKAKCRWEDPTFRNTTHRCMPNQVECRPMSEQPVLRSETSAEQPLTVISSLRSSWF